jgi:hypothetical protein
VLVLPHGDAGRLPKNVLSFCFPDVRELGAHPFSEDHAATEYTFALSPKDEPRTFGFCRRYRVSSSASSGRLDMGHLPLPGDSAAGVAEAPPSWQCICILSERYVREDLLPEPGPESPLLFCR